MIGIHSRIGKKEKVLVLGEGTRSFLTVVRSLGRKGLEIHVGSHLFDLIAVQSRYITEIHYLPSPDDTEKWKNEILRMIEAEKFELIIPTNDPTNILCRKHRYELERFSRVYLLDENAYLMTNDKMKTYTLARSLGVNAPNSRLIENNMDLAQLLSEFGFPVMLKPVSSFSEGNLRSKQYVKKVNTERELETLLNEMLSAGPVIVQEYFDGVGVGLEVLAYNGEILTKFQHIRIHEPRGGGASTYRKSMPVDDDLLEAANRIMAALSYTGVAMLEFKVDYENNKWALLEINGRFWGSLPLAVSSGMDFPYYMYQMLVKGKREFPQKYKENIYCRNTTLDLAWMKENFKENKRKVASEASNLLLLRERNDTFVLDDPMPGIMEAGNILQSHLSALIRKARFKMVNISYSRRRKSRKLRKEMSKARRILFVCKGNICRSPFAEYYARKIFSPGVTIQSCGTYPQEGRKSPIEAIDTAQEFGINLSEHQSRAITDEMMNGSDIIFVFDWENMQQLIANYPSQKRKIWYISELNPECPLLTPDPYGKGQTAYKETYQRIMRSLDMFREKAAR